MTQELYGCSRMLLAVLSREQLQEVRVLPACLLAVAAVLGRRVALARPVPGADVASAASLQVCGSWRCDMWDLLAPLRAVRPANGGPGFDEELVLELRTLNFELG